MKTKCYLTIDVGSSSIRVSLFDRDFRSLDVRAKKLLASASIDAEAYFDEIRRLILSLTQSGDHEILAIAASSLVGWVILSRDGRPLGPARTWMDQAPAECAEFAAASGEEEFYRRTGRRLSPELGGLKLRRLKNEEPERYARAAALLTIKDYINFRLTGSLCTDRTSACYTALYNTAEADWDRELAEAMGVDAVLLPELHSSDSAAGALTDGMAAELGLKPGIPVAVSGPDGSVGVLGAGGVHCGTAVSVMGTTDVTFAVSGSRAEDRDRRLVVNPHVLPGLWLVGGSLGLTGGTVDWMAANLLENRYSLKELDERGAEVPPGCDGVRFIPSLTGERAPFWNAAVRGTVAGLSPSHGIPHLFRALLEANCYTVRSLLEVVEGSGVPVGRILAIGGGARSDLWMRIKSSVTGKPVAVPDCLEATTRGCVLLAAMAAGETVSAERMENPVGRTYAPEPAESEAYDRAYADYLALMDAACGFYGRAGRD